MGGVTYQECVYIHVLQMDAHVKRLNIVLAIRPLRPSARLQRFKACLSSPRAERARAVTVSQCRYSGVGQDFLLRRRVTLTETAVTRKQKVKKSIQRCQIDRLAKVTNGPLTKSGVL